MQWGKCREAMGTLVPAEGCQGNLPRGASAGTWSGMSCWSCLGRGFCREGTRQRKPLGAWASRRALMVVLLICSLWMSGLCSRVTQDLGLLKTWGWEALILPFSDCIHHPDGVPCSKAVMRSWCRNSAHPSWHCLWRRWHRSPEETDILDEMQTSYLCPIPRPCPCNCTGV